MIYQTLLQCQKRHNHSVATSHATVTALFYGLSDVSILETPQESDAQSTEEHQVITLAVYWTQGRLCDTGSSPGAVDPGRPRPGRYADT